MSQEEESFAINQNTGSQDKIILNKNLMVIAVCVGVSMLFMKTGLLTFFFLVPLGCAVLISGSMWYTFLVAAGVNIVLSVLLNLFNNSTFLWMDIFYFSTIIFMFIWIIGGSSLRTAYRFILGSAAGALAFLFFIFYSRDNAGFNTVMYEIANIFASMLSSNVNHNEIQQVITANRVLELIKVISLRGGALFSVLIMFFLNRLLTIFVLRFIKRQGNNQIKEGFGLIRFFAPVNTIWVFSASLALILLTRSLKIEFLEILSWNVLTVSVIFFLAQGIGIVLHHLSGRTPMFRIIVITAIFFITLSPLNTIAFIALLLLGVLETWLPFRRKKLSTVNS